MLEKESKDSLIRYQPYQYDLPSAAYQSERLLQNNFQSICMYISVCAHMFVCVCLCTCVCEQQVKVRLQGFCMLQNQFRLLDTFHMVRCCRQIFSSHPFKGNERT